MNTQIIRPPSPIKAGIMMIWPTDTAPSGWLLCFGQAISRAGYSGLFAAIGTTFGVGDGTTTFNLPDYRGRVPLGKDNMGGVSANRVTNAQADTIGGAAGDEELAAHVHTGPSHTHSFPLQTPTSEIGGATPTRALDSGSPTGSNTGSSGTGNTGSTGAGANNMSPYLTLNYIIKI